jgi:hypothetical protein
VTVCVLRDYERLPEVGNDLDVMVEPAQRAAFRRTVNDFALEHGLQPVRFADHYHVLLMRFLGFDDEGHLLKLFVDEHSRGAGWWGAQYMTTTEVMSGARSSGAWLVPRPAHEAAMMLLTHLLIGGFVKTKHVSRVARLVEADLEEFRRIAHRAFGMGHGDLVTQAARQQEIPALESAAATLRRRHVARSALSRAPSSVRWIAAETISQSRLKFGRQGLVIRLAGEDPVPYARSLAEGLGPLFKGVWFVGEEFDDPDLHRAWDRWQILPSGRTVSIYLGMARERLVVVSAGASQSEFPAVPTVLLSTEDLLSDSLRTAVGLLADRVELPNSLPGARSL